MGQIKIPHSRPTIGENEVRSVSKVMLSGQIAQGEMVEKLETNLREYFGVKGAVLTNSGTSALHLGLIAMGVGSGDEVLLPSYVCTAPLNAIYMAGALPVLCDIELRNFNISRESMDSRLSDKTKAVIVPHMFGNVADIDKISEPGIKVIEDCAHSAGALYSGCKAGSMGEFSIISFYANKMIAAGEGGAVLSNNEELLESVKDMRDYDEKEEYKLRFNYKMTDIQAAVGIEQLSRLDGFINRRKALAAGYQRAFKNIDVICPEWEFDHVFYRYVIRIRKNVSEVMDRLREKNIIAAKPVYKPLHRYFETRAGFKRTDEVYATSLSLPIYPDLSDEAQKVVIEAVIGVIG
jgi:perosamine synthetase